MDGYAVGAGEGRYRIVGEARTGGAEGGKVGEGECVRIFTGAEIPEGAVKVVKQEDARVEQGWMTVERDCAMDYVRRRGEDARAGDCLIRVGTRLGAAEIGLLAGMGIVAPVISRRSRVAHFTTGDEVIDPGLVPGRGQIRDSNGALVRAFVETMGGEMVWQERVSDDVGALTERVRAAVEGGADMVLVSGGASVGDYDFGSRAIEGAGFEVHFGRVKLRPGKPLVFATRGRQVAFVLPGNPLSHLAVLNCVVRVAFERMAGIEPELRVLNARLRVGIGMGGIRCGRGGWSTKAGRRWCGH
jgi:molybdopterin molybdotransferase